MVINTESADTSNAAPRRWRPLDWLIVAAGATLCGTILDDAAQFAAIAGAVVFFLVGVAGVVVSLITGAAQMGFFRLLAAILVMAVAGTGLLQDGVGLAFWPQYKEYRTCADLAITDVTRQDCLETLQTEVQRRVEELSAG